LLRVLVLVVAGADYDEPVGAAGERKGSVEEITGSSKGRVDSSTGSDDLRRLALRKAHLSAPGAQVGGVHS